MESLMAQCHITSHRGVRRNGSVKTKVGYEPSHNFIEIRTMDNYERLGRIKFPSWASTSQEKTDWLYQVMLVLALLSIYRSASVGWVTIMDPLLADGVWDNNNSLNT